MNAKHTPGPWHIGMKPGPMIYGPKGEQVADMRHKPFTLVSEIDESVANVRLISAAPDLLAALEIAEGRLMCIDAQKLDTVARNDDVIDRIRTAIAKAKGE